MFSELDRLIFGLRLTRYLKESQSFLIDLATTFMQFYGIYFMKSLKDKGETNNIKEMKTISNFIETHIKNFNEFLFGTLLIWFNLIPVIKRQH